MAWSDIEQALANLRERGGDASVTEAIIGGEPVQHGSGSTRKGSTRKGSTRMARTVLQNSDRENCEGLLAVESDGDEILIAPCEWHRWNIVEGHLYLYKIDEDEKEWTTVCIANVARVRLVPWPYDYEIDLG